MRPPAVLEQHFDLVERQPELLAHHLTAAGDTARAVDQWMKAGRHVAERSAHLDGGRMTVDASQSCLGLGTCVGSAIRQIVDARVHGYATIDTQLVWGVVENDLGSLCAAITQLLGDVSGP